jgi:hypothetical protein
VFRLEPSKEAPKTFTLSFAEWKKIARLLRPHRGLPRGLDGYQSIFVVTVKRMRAARRGPAAPRTKAGRLGTRPVT